MLNTNVRRRAKGVMSQRFQCLHRLSPANISMETETIMTTAFELMFPEDSAARTLLTELIKNPADFNHFLNGIPVEYRAAFAKQKFEPKTVKPAAQDITCFEVTGFYKKKTDARSSEFIFNLKAYTKDGTAFDLSEPDWAVWAFMVTPKNFAAWQKRNKPSAETILRMQEFFDHGFTHVAPMLNKDYGSQEIGGSYFGANITAKTVSDAFVMFPDSTMRIPAEAFKYEENNAKFKNSDVFAKYRYSVLTSRPSWKSIEEWVTR